MSFAATYLEDKAAVDGPGFHYFSNVARMSTVRMFESAVRPGRNVPGPARPRAGKVGHRFVSPCDVSSALLQSDPFPREVRRLLKIRSPIDGSVTYWRHRIPLPVYGSCSVPCSVGDHLLDVADDTGECWWPRLRPWRQGAVGVLPRCTQVLPGLVWTFSTTPLPRYYHRGHDLLNVL